MYSLYSYTNFVSEVINIDFLQIWPFDVKGAGCVGGSGT